MALPLDAIDTDDDTRIFPWANVGLIVANFLVFFYELALIAGALNKFFFDFSSGSSSFPPASLPGCSSGSGSCTSSSTGSQL
jgi:membrane associated rhomboid family serine protease